MENNTIERYIATITVGDEYHNVGEEHVLSTCDVDKTKKLGLRIEIIKNDRGHILYHLYPCKIRKETYRLEPINTEEVPGGDRMDVPYDRGRVGYGWIDNDDYDWRDHWC